MDGLWKTRPEDSIALLLKSARRRTVFDVPKLKTEIAELEQETSRPDFWENADEAQKTQQRLREIKEEVARWDGFASEVEALRKDWQALAELDGTHGNLDDPEFAGLKTEWETRVQDIERRFRKAELQALLAGPYDRNAALLSLYAGAGGVDAQDWAEMLARMYSRYAEERGWKVIKLAESRGEEQGIKSVTFHVEGRYVYGYLKGENGVHRLVRISPFSPNKLRHTSFAMVEVLPVFAEGESDISIKPDELAVDLFRSSGPGGQNVNKRETAVRITHVPTGIVVASQEERQQSSNRERAMAMLRAKLFQLMQQEKTQELAKLKGKRVKIEWGHQIRSYVLHPYKMVKDLRTNVETPRVQDVLDGELDEFIEAELRSDDAARYDVERRVKQISDD
ncbi:peptide chain release factor 2 [Candidatus Parcubacteria bacterium]|nr:peptide chain release factor 2 [Candidatus Parcubacteria bacterium]